MLTAFGDFNTQRIRLSEFTSLLKTKISEFKKQPLLVLRTGNYYCCNSESVTGLHTRKRIKLFSDYAQSVLTAAFPKLKLWDAYTLGESRPLKSIAHQV